MTRDEMIAKLENELDIRGLTYSDVGEGIGYSETYIQKVFTGGFPFVDTCRLFNSICHWAKIPYLSAFIEQFGFTKRYQNRLNSQEKTHLISVIIADLSSADIDTLKKIKEML